MRPRRPPTLGAAMSDGPSDPGFLGAPLPRWWPKAVAALWIGFVVMLMGRWLFHRLHPLLVILLVSLFLSLAVEPAVNALARRGWRRGVATALVMLGVVIAMSVFVAAIGTLLFRQIGNLIDRSPDYIERILNWVNDTFG